MTTLDTRSDTRTPTFSRTFVEKPCADAVTLYVPTGTAAAMKLPLASACKFHVAAVS